MGGPDALRRDWKRAEQPARRTANDNRRDVQVLADAPELACLTHLLSPGLLRKAASRSRDLGVGADQVLMQWGVIDEHGYLMRLEAYLGIAIDTLADVDPADAPLTPDQWHLAAGSGLLPVRRDRRLIWTMAPQHMGARGLARFAAASPDLIDRLRLTTQQHLREMLQYRSGVLTDDAIRGQLARRTNLSASPRPGEPLRARRVMAAAAVVAATIAATVTTPLWSNLLAFWFLAFIGLRLAASVTPPRHVPDRPRLRDHDLPVYSIIIALYREALSVPWLLHAINDLDYPHEKLDVIIAVEADDLATQAAIARFGAMRHLRVLVAPTGGPRTKPKALNAALPFTRGSFIAVYDAEDRPQPDQLRVALDAFRDAGQTLACVQARLGIDNSAESLFSRMFAVEYAGQFDLVLPGLARLGLPLPLGGSSNHFRADTLRDIGGWDAYNVTEDADLGFRLARFGYRSATIASRTDEEAPIRFMPWLRQRSRWMKGWMQTWRVHMRDPLQLWRDAGLRGFFGLNLLIGGHVLTALAYPILLVGFVFYLIVVTTFGEADWFVTGLLSPLNLLTFGAGYVATAFIGLRALARQGRLRDGWILLLTPIYWLCLSIAAWRAFWQLFRDPYHWEKTDHGVTQRRAP